MTGIERWLRFIIDCDGLVTQALLTANFEAAVDVCLQHGRMADALLLAIAGGGDLLSRTQKAYFDRNKSNVSQVIKICWI